MFHSCSDLKCFGDVNADTVGRESFFECFELMSRESSSRESGQFKFTLELGLL